MKRLHGCFVSVIEYPYSFKMAVKEIFHNDADLEININELEVT